MQWTALLWASGSTAATAPLFMSKTWMERSDPPIRTTSESQLGKKQIVAFDCYFWTEIYVSNNSSTSGHFLCICWHWPEKLLLSLSRHPSVCCQAVWLRFPWHGLLHSPTTVWSCLVRSLLNNADKSCFNGFIFVKPFLFLQLWTLTFRMTDLATLNELLNLKEEK